MIERFGLDADSHVVEIASNDGYLLQYFHERRRPGAGHRAGGQRRRGRAPEGDPHAASSSSACDTARSLAPESSADLLLGNNVLAHVPDLNDFVAGMKILLKPGGVITMEFPHLLRLIEENQWDTIYHEHFSYFSFVTVSRVFAAHGLRLFDVEELPTHGGSLRIYGATPTTPSRPRRERGRASCASASAPPATSDLETYLGYGPRVAGGQATDPQLPDRAQAPGSTRSSATARRRRATRCSTTAASAPTSSTTRATATRTSRATSCPAATSRSARPTDPRGPPGRRADPAVEPQGRDHRAARRSSASGAGASRRATPELTLLP